jgi:hypothetical protein
MRSEIYRRPVPRAPVAPRNATVIKESVRAKVAAVPVLLVLLLAACAESGPSPERAARFRSAMDAVCQAETNANAREYRASYDAFAGKAHAYLHTLAAQVEREDPAVAARLFEAKQQVEETFRNPPFYGPTVMVQRFDDLEEAMREAAAVVGLPEATCGA